MSRGTREAIEVAIFENRLIADLTDLRSFLLEQVARPADWLMHNRAEHLRPFASFFQRVCSPDSPSLAMRSLVARLAKNAVTGQLDLLPEALRPAAPQLDTRFNDAQDLIPLLFKAIFESQELLDEWVHLLDGHVKDSSVANLAAMDQAARLQGAPVRKDVVLVGGGPITSIVASILGPFFHVTVVTDQRDLGKPWRNRKSIRLNSSCSIADFSAPPLPLLGGPTTRVVGSQQWNSLDVDTLPLADALRVVCNNGNNLVFYLPGYLFGALVATDIVFHADDYLVRQRCDVSTIKRNADGSLRLSLIDVDSGTRRSLDAAAVFLLTGPAPEQTRLNDRASRLFYQRASQEIDLAIADGRSDLARELATQKDLEAAFPTAAAQEFRKQRLASEATSIARDIRRRLPHLLTLTSLEKLFEVWEELESLGADPASFPLYDVIQSKSIAYIGNGDTARTLKEWADGRGPRRAYPRDFSRGCAPCGTIYNEEALSREAYAQTTRRRYQDVFTPTTRAIPSKASRYRPINDARGRARVEVTHQDGAGRRLRRRYDYIFDATGLGERRIEQELPDDFSMRTLFDPQGYQVGLRETRSDLYILGVATGWKGQDFPLEIQRILEALDIHENTLALWAHGLLAERAAYAFTVSHPKTKAPPSRSKA